MLTQHAGCGRWNTSGCYFTKSLDCTLPAFYRQIDGAALFYKKATKEFAVLHKNGVIGTCFAPSQGFKYWLNQIQ